MTPALLAALVLLPFVATLMLTLISSWRIGKAITAASNTLGFLLACALSMQPASRSWGLSITPTAQYLVLLTGFVAMAAGWFNVREAAGAMSSRRHHASAQLLLGSVILGLLSDQPALTWLALALAIVAITAGAPPRAAGFLPCAAAMLLALAGTLLLYLAGDVAPSGRTLNFAGIFLLLGYGALAGQVPLHAWWIDTSCAGLPLPSIGVTTLLVNVPLFTMLRFLKLGVAPELLLALGLASLLVAAGAMWRQAERGRAVSHAVMAMLGIVVFAIGLGEVDVALLLIGLQSVVAAATRQSLHLPVVWARRVAMLCLALLPLYAVYLLAGDVAERSIWLLAPFALGALAASWRLIMSSGDG